MGMRGMTLVEVLIVLVLGSIVGGLIVNMFVTSNRTYMDQGKVLDVQRSGRVAMEAMGRLLREAGLDPQGSANAGITEATATRVQFTRDANLNGVIDAGNHETIVFDYAGEVLRRRYDGGNWVDMADNVADFSFSYFDADGLDIGVPGSAADELAKIRSMELMITFKDDKYSGGDFVRSYTTGILCRNLAP